ncbi:MAG TPA: cytochrome P450 [Caulobacteraceae bacterium]|nr:cytochrome P450 [Caulobacteraceae bacterium]
MTIAVKAEAADAADAEAYVPPLAELNPGNADRFEAGTHWPVFKRLRAEDPVHFTPDSEFGPYWSITKWDDIMAVDTNHEVFSSVGGIVLSNLQLAAERLKLPGERTKEEQIEAARRGEGASFIGLDEPYHGPKRKAVSPTLAPANIALMAPLVRKRAGQILDALPIGETFDWVDVVSKELTSMTLATMLDFPFEERRKLLYWTTGDGVELTPQERLSAAMERQARFDELWEQKLKAPPAMDMISMMAHNPMTRNMSRHEYQGNVVLLIIGGNDTTRNTISGSVYELNRNPDQYAKLRANPELIPAMVAETIRYQTPLAHMARTALRDIEVGGKTIHEGDRVAMWYISGNRDEDVIAEPNVYNIERERPRHHMSFGFGVHRCVGNRVAEMQLTIIWEEILKRFPEITVAGEHRRSHSSFIHGFETLPVVIPARA